MDDSLTQLGRSISTISLSNGVSPNGSQVTIKMVAFCHSIKVHSPLHLSDIEREQEILRKKKEVRGEVDSKKLRIHPVCLFVRRRVDDAEVGVRSFGRRVEREWEVVEGRVKGVEKMIGGRLRNVELKVLEVERSIRARVFKRGDGFVTLGEEEEGPCLEHVEYGGFVGFTVCRSRRGERRKEEQRVDVVEMIGVKERIPVARS